MAIQVDRTIEVSAEFSNDTEQSLRFSLTKAWGNGEKKALFILLNPSKADIVRMDNTFANVVNYCVDANFDAVTVVNLFLYRATEPKDLAGKYDLGLSENIKVFQRELELANEVFIAWGTEHKKYSQAKKRFESVLKERANGKRISCWYDEKGNYPKHLRILGKN
ncbi:DUF1643 domain-containing protein [Vibrio parahaemolyticus]|uniref:DUF1643 domain-containing protein n=1 Tax=Vibrio parahaemolyticus TaxID=670 RepID=UPI001553EEAB|nr:DUF1643 domain-containing protein [Vibrio parahaemolyticus]